VRACLMTLCRELYRSGWTDRDALLVVDSDGSRNHVLHGSAHWRNPANTIEPSVCGGDAAFLSNYFDPCSFLIIQHCSIYCFNKFVFQ